jgi:hypothetical protein
MATSPDILLHRFFQTLTSPKDRQNHRGKHDLSGIDPSFQELLLAVQVVINSNFQNEKPGVASHVEHPPFHFDYIDSTIENAVAFRYEGYSFIGLTIRLFFRFWDISDHLGNSPLMAELIAIEPEVACSGVLRVVLFRTLYSFVVAHEFTHHVHGHVVTRESDGSFFQRSPSTTVL